MSQPTRKEERIQLLQRYRDELKAWTRETEQYWDELTESCFDVVVEINGIPLNKAIEGFRAGDAGISNSLLDKIAKHAGDVGAFLSCAHRHRRRWRCG